MSRSSIFRVGRPPGSVFFPTGHHHTARAVNAGPRRITKATAGTGGGAAAAIKQGRDAEIAQPAATQAARGSRSRMETRLKPRNATPRTEPKTTSRGGAHPSTPSKIPAIQADRDESERHSVEPRVSCVGSFSGVTVPMAWVPAPSGRGGIGCGGRERGRTSKRGGEGVRFQGSEMIPRPGPTGMGGAPR